jgi:hypothetical protein
LISQTKYWYWSIPQFHWPGDEHRYLGQQVRRGRKTLLTLENCGELDSHLGSGFSRSIGKTDNTHLPHPRASAIRRAKFRKFELEVSEVRGGVQNRATRPGKTAEIRKATSGWLFLSMADHWPPKGSPSEASLRDVVRPAAVGPLGTELCAPDLSRRTRICEPRASLAAYLVAVDMPFHFFITINELAFGCVLFLPIFGSPAPAIILESIETPPQTAAAESTLALAVGTKVGAAASQEDAPNRRPANQAR